jgi:peroxiredoxin
MELGSPLPNTEIALTGGVKKNLASFKGKPLLLYFYPKDDTPGCTLEGRDFSALYTAFQELGVEIVGVSRDSLSSHERFCSKHGLAFPLASDPDGALCQLFGVLGEKSMYGRKSIGIIRSTFLFDSAGLLVWAQGNVKAAGHAAEMLNQARNLLAGN